MTGRRPKDVTTYHVFRTGASNNNLEVLRDGQDKACAYYLERPSGKGILQYPRDWQFFLYANSRGSFNVGEEALFRIFRNQADATIEFWQDNGPGLVFTLEWAGKGDVGGLAAAPREHLFFYKGRKYEWREHSHLTGKDFVCKDLATKETVAYFRAVMTPQTKEGKLEIGRQVEDSVFQDILVATCIAYREWCIRRTMLLFGDPYFNQSVTG